MRRSLVIAVAVAVGSVSAQGQDSGANRGTAGSSVQTETVKVYGAGADVTPPALLSAIPIEIRAGKCKSKDASGGIVELQLIVDATGTARNISFLQALGDDLDKAALALAHSDRFTPGTYKGAPAAVWQELDIRFAACTEHAKDAAGKKVDVLRLTAQPEQRLGSSAQGDSEVVFAKGQYGPDGFKDDRGANVFKVGGRVKAPAPLKWPEAVFSEEARRKRINGVCLLEFFVDSEGMPHDIRVVRGIGYGLDENAMAAVRKYRFRPAMRDGIQPVPVRLTVEVNFRLY